MVQYSQDSLQWRQQLGDATIPNDSSFHEDSSEGPWRMCDLSVRKEKNPAASRNRGAKGLYLVAGSQ